MEARDDMGSGQMLNVLPLPWGVIREYTHRTAVYNERSYVTTLFQVGGAKKTPNVYEKCLLKAVDIILVSCLPIDPIKLGLDVRLGIF
jgi:hypothetical protein